MNNITCAKPIFTIATDPIYIGTGGYTIGRVDNTIVRDPITKIPKIPGSSLAGTWRYYVALELISKVKEYQPNFNDIKNRIESSLEEKIKNQNWKNGFSQNNWISYFGNKIAKITCAGQDNVPAGETKTPDKTDKEGNTGHCGHCIVCKSFGYSKKDKSWQGMVFFSDLNILFFPVYTRLGVKWITSERILKETSVGAHCNVPDNEKRKIVYAQKEIEEGKEAGYINLGWLNLPYEIKDCNINVGAIHESPDKIHELPVKDIIVVPDSIISQIINSNLEVRTSVSIDPITGAAKEGALFTSEAIPRGTVFYGEVRVFDKKGLGDNNLPSKECILEALEDTKHYYETLGIGGMTTRGFGRMKVISDLKDGACREETH
ncbi:MAG: hypothetical protein J7L08_04050 [Candidatus Aenigmarchaeota archaeon]|nr:hypothetical protein [Candidatus Aenigmarchaeota archaeon]